MTARLQSLRLPTELDLPTSFGPYRLELSKEAEAVLIDRRFLIQFTPIEYGIFCYLLERPHTYVSEQEILVVIQEVKSNRKNKNVHTWNGNLKAIERHIKSLRDKLFYSGLKIFRVVGSGWLLTHEGTQASLPQTRIPSLKEGAS